MNIDHVFIHSDLNGTAAFADSTKPSNPIISEIAGEISYAWDGSRVEPYKEYVERVLAPGHKYDDQVRVARALFINNFLKFLKECDHPMYQTTLSRYNEIAPPYIDESGNATFTIFPSLLNLIHRIAEVSTYTLIVRTFGPDGEMIAGEFEKNGLKLERKGIFNQNEVEIDGRKIEVGSELLHALKGKHICGRDRADEWKNTGLAVHGKWIQCAEDAEFNGQTVVSIILDDNLKKKEKDERQPLDPSHKNIAYPVGSSGKPVPWGSRGIIKVRINTIKASLDPNYMIRKVNKELLARGFAPLKEK